MLSHWCHSTGHLVIRVCCAATATNYTLTQTWAQALAHRHNHTLTAKVTVTRSFKVDARSIVKVTRVPSCSSLHKSQLIFWCARAWKLLKKSKEKTCPVLSLMSMSHHSKAVWDLLGEKELFLLTEKRRMCLISAFQKSVKSVSLCETLIMCACWGFTKKIWLSVGWKCFVLSPAWTVRIPSGWITDGEAVSNKEDYLALLTLQILKPSVAHFFGASLH